MSTFVKNSTMAVTPEILKKREKVSSILQSARVQLGLTQEELAERTGYSRSTIIRIEQNQFSPNADQLYVLCQVLNIDLKINGEKI